MEIDRKLLGVILFISLIASLSCNYYFGDIHLDNEWGIIFHNYEISKIMGYNVVINDFLAVPKIAEAGETVLPTALMPPLYFFFILSIKTLSGDLIDLVSVIKFAQIFIGLISILIFYRILKILSANKKINLLLTSIYAFFPLNIYSQTQISSATLQIFLITAYFFFLIDFITKNKFKKLIFFSVISGLLVLIRGEFLFFYIVTIIYFFIFLKKNFLVFILSIIVVIFVTSPYLYRNYINFDSLIFTKSFGYNLLKGNNPSLIVEGNSKFIDENFKNKDLNFKADKKYEFKLDDFYKTQALNYIRNDPIKYFKLYLKKIFSYIFLDFNSTYPNYYNFIHIIPKILISIFCFLGAILAFSKKGVYQFLTIYYILNISIFSVFFILPRYSVTLLPVQLLLTLEVLKFLNKKFFN